jgi:Domain of unknown function (DUF4261)
MPPTNQMSPEENHRFICYLVLGSAKSANSEELCQLINTHFGSLLDLLGKPSTAGEVSVGQEGFLIKFGDSVLAVIFMQRPLPEDAWGPAVKLDRFWPDALKTMQKHKTHLVVSNVTTAKSHGDRLKLASAVTITSAALSMMLQAQAIVWASGDVIIEPQRFAMDARSIQNGDAPVGSWLSLTWLDGSSDLSGVRTFAVLTSGLMPFLDREIELAPTALPPLTIAEIVYSAAAYLVAKGPVIESGETIGLKSRPMMRATLKTQGQRRGVPVIELEVLPEQAGKNPHGRLPGLGG